jgi:hypothetical protein
MGRRRSGADSKEREMHGKRHGFLGLTAGAAIALTLALTGCSSSSNYQSSPTASNDRDPSASSGSGVFGTGLFAGDAKKGGSEGAQGRWNDAAVGPEVAAEFENAVLTQARELRLRAVAQTN